MFYAKSIGKMLQNIAKHLCKCFSTMALKHFLQMFCKRFILYITTSYLQHVFNMLKHKNVLQHFCKCFILRCYRGTVHLEMCGLMAKRCSFHHKDP